MSNLRIYFLLAPILLFPLVLQAQIATKTGSIYGKVIDFQKTALSGVSVTLESNVIPTQVATTGSSGSFRFTNLPPGIYSVTFTLAGFAEVRQEDIRVTTAANIELQILLASSLLEEVTVSGQTSLLDSKKTANDSTYSREYLDDVPNGRDPWFLINMTPGVDSDRLNTGSESGFQSSFYSRGGGFDSNTWNYDGVDKTTAYPFLATTSYDFDALEEIHISTGGNDASVQTGGVAVHLVTKRGGNKWAVDASYYFVNEDLQSTNTPQELIDQPLINVETGKPARGSNRIHDTQEYGINAGGPLIKDKFFVWSGYRKSHVNLFNVVDGSEDAILTQYSLKLNFHLNSTNESQLGYFEGSRHRQNFAVAPGIQAPETFWEQENTPLHGIWTLQHNWIPGNHFLLTARYGNVGEGFQFTPAGGTDQPMIILNEIPRIEETNSLYRVEQPAQDISVEANYFKDDMLRGDHEFKFGFEYKASDVRIFSSYGNGVMIIDYCQTLPNGPLISGDLYAFHYLNSDSSFGRLSFYATDTFRMDRLTLNLGFRFDHQDGKNNPSDVPAVPGFEQFVGSITYKGGNPGIAFSNISPRLGGTFDVTGDGKTIIRANFARYYDAFHPFLVQHSNPTGVYNGASFSFQNQNGDRTIDLDELSDPTYFGGLTQGGFDLSAFLSTRKYDPNLSNGWSNEFLVGVQRQLTRDLSVSSTYTYRKYGDIWASVPFGINTADYVPGGEYNVSTALGDFSVPYFVLPEGFDYDGTVILQNIKDYTQTYHGVDIVVQKRMSHNFLLNGAFTIQKQIGHYNGGDSLAGQSFDPTNLPLLDEQPYAYGGNYTKEAVYPYAGWSLKISGVYLFPWDVSAGAYLRYQQGYPFVLFGIGRGNPALSALYPGTHRILLEPVGTRRFDNVLTLDLKIEKTFEASSYGRITAIVDIFNLTNENAILARNDKVESLSFNQIQEVLAPRAVRLGVRYSF